MPFVNIKTTVVVIEEIETDNWGIGGESVTVLRSKAPTTSGQQVRTGHS